MTKTWNVREMRSVDPPALIHAHWAEAFPWLIQGTTVRGGEGEPFDLGLFSRGLSQEQVRRNWTHLKRVTGARSVVHAPQPHGSEVCVHGELEIAVPDGDPRLVDACDGHVTAQPGVLLAITTADCVPVFLVDEGRCAVAAVHAGWRGAAAGVLEVAFERLREAFGTETRDLHVHFGPAICGSCYEVGPEVFDALGQQPVPTRPTPIDLRAILAVRALASGVREERISISEHCTLCSDEGLFSHRRGDAHRQVGYIGIRV